MNAPTDKHMELAAFRKLDADAQLRLLRGTKLERTFEVEREAIDQEARTAWLSIASEQPYERWWGVEILDVRAASIRDERLKRGAPLLVGHDTSDQVGVVEKYEITPDRKLRILARFGRSARAEEIWQDVLDGIRRNTSVGYIIHDLVLEKKEDNVGTYRVTDWEPLEGSLVAVPADPTVGVGRAIEAPVALAQPPEKETNMEDNKVDSGRAVEDAVRREQKRVADILAAGEQYKAHGGVEVAARLARDPQGNLEQFSAEMLERMSTKAPATATAQPAESAPFGSGARQILRAGAQLRAFTKPIVYSDGTCMAPIEAAYRAGQWLLATVGQNQDAQRWCRDHGLEMHTRVMTTDVDTAGGYLVPDEMEQAIIDLRESYGLARRLARRSPMSTDTKSIPKRTGGVTAYFVNEDNSGVTAADKSWGNVNLVAKTLAALSIISKNLDEDSIIDVVDDLAAEQAYAFATKEDQCWLVGDGTSTYAGMTGLVTLFEASALASRFNAATGNDTFAEFTNNDLTGTMAVVADFAGLNPVWVCSKAFDAAVMGRLKAAAGGNSIGTLEGRIMPTYLGYPVYTSEIMRSNVTADVSDVIVAFFGDFSKSTTFGDRRGIVVEVLRERYAEKLQVGILGHERFHIVNHDVGTTSVKGPVAGLYGD